ncbi:MAG TPA: MFS transporter [Caldisericia bacterium]|nr:MFS transporter [Caldisericia bacterium]HQL66563.1 MFS transporter [Caldisericia bacterium]
MKFFQLIGLDEVYSFKKGVLFLFAILFFTGIFLNADQNVMSPSIQFIEEEFKIGDKEIGIIGSAFTLVAAVVTLLWGYLTDKFSRKWLLVIAILLGEIPCLLTAFAQNYTQLLILRILTGIGIGGTVPVVFSIIGDLFTEKQRARAQAWYDAIIAVGVIVGMVVAGFIAPIYGWRLPFIIVSVPDFFFVLGIIIWGREPERGAGEQEIRELVIKGAKYKSSIKLKDYLELLKIPSNIWLFIQGIPGTVAWGIIPYYLITFYFRHKNYPIQLGTVLLIILGIGTIFGKFVGGIVGNKLYLKKRSYLPIFCGLSQLIGVIPVMVTLYWPGKVNPTFIDVLPPSIFGFLGAFFISFAGPNVKAMLMNVNLPEHRGAISSIFNLTDSIGAGFGPFIGGLISSIRDLDFSMKVSALFWIPCGILFFVVSLFINRDAEKIREKMAKVRESMEKNE